MWNVLNGEERVTPADGSSNSSPWIARWSPGERFVVSGHMNGAVRIWKNVSGRLELQKVCENSHERDVRGVWFSEESGEDRSPTTFWTASVDGTLRQWTLPAGSQVGEARRAPVEEPLEYQEISTSGKYAVTMLRNGASLIWEIESETVKTRLSNPSPDPYTGQIRTACVFSPDESCVAVMTGATEVTIYHATTGEAIVTIPGSGVALEDMSFSRDGRMLLTVSEAGRARVWSVSPDPQSDRVKAHRSEILQIDQDAAGEFLLTSSYDGTASVWKLPEMRHLETYAGHEAEIFAADLSPDGARAATLDAEGELHVWDVASGTRIFRIEPRSEVEPGSDVEPESEGLARHLRGAGGGLRSNMLNFPAPLSTGIFTPDGRHVVAFQDGAMRVFNALNGKQVTRLEKSRTAGWPVYSHDSSLVTVLGMNERTATVWNLKTGVLLHRRIEHLSSLVMMDFSPVDHRLVTGAMENDIQIWDASTGRLLHVLKGDAGNVTSCRFSNDGHYVLAGYGGSTGRIWDAHTGELVTTLAHDHSQRIRDMRMSPDKTRILTWAMDDKAVVWDLSEPKARALVKVGGESQLLQARWSSGGKDITLAWSNGQVELLRGATREDFHHLPAETGLTDEEILQWRRRHTNAVRR